MCAAVLAYFSTKSSTRWPSLTENTAVGSSGVIAVQLGKRNRGARRRSIFGGCRNGGAKEAAEKRFPAVILSPFAVILSMDSHSAAHDGQKLDEETRSPKLSS
jgi:hypothetical protein